MPETYSFRDLHIAIQDVMGWGDYHLYEFHVDDVSIEADEEGFCVDAMWKAFRHESRTASAGKTRLSEFIKKEKQKFRYLYDLGDNWKHKVELEKILPRKKDIAYPICITGKRACPPDDCGGVWGYENFLEIIEDPNHSEHEEMLEWIGGEFDPEYFDVKEIHFRGLMTRNKRSKQVIV